MKRFYGWLTACAVVAMMTGCAAKPNVEKPTETAKDAVKNMIAGWNLGNTFDAFSTGVAPGSPTDRYETSWGQPVTEEFLMKKMAKKGFTAIRVPVTWWQHMNADGQVDSAWMARVDTVVNYVLNNGMYCIINVEISNNKVYGS